MPGGVSLGSAYVELTANSAGLIQALNQAEQASKRSVQAIAQATGIPEKAVQRLAQTWIAAEKQRADASAQSALRTIKAHNDAAAAADKAAAQQAKSSQSAAAGMLGLVKGLTAFGAAAAGVSIGAATINAAMTSIAESTQKAAQAQFALNALYGKAAPIITQQAEELAKASGRSRTEALEAATAVATLGRQYALTFAQQKQVLEISANLAAVRGIPLEEATKRVSDALRGEAEAAEYLGQVLNSDAVKAFANMTAEQRKNFETLDPLTKAQIVLGKLIGDNADLMGKAAERANSAVGAYDKFTASVDNLSVSIGKKFSEPAAGALGILTGFVERADAFVRSDFLDRLGRTAAYFAAIASLDPAKIAAAFGALQGSLPAFQVGPDPGSPGGTTLGPTSPATTAAIEEERRRQEKRIEADRKNRIKAELEAAEKANDATAESAIKAIEKERKAKEQWYDEERDRIEARRTYQLEDIERRKDAAIEALEEEKRAAKEALEAQIEDQERLKDARIAAAEEAAEQAERLIDIEKDRLDTVRELEDRARDDERRQQDQALDDARRAQDQLRDDERRSEDVGLDAARRRQDQDREMLRRGQDRATDDARRRQDQAAEDAQDDEIKRLERVRDVRVAAIEEDIRLFEQASQRRLRAIDEEGDAAREASEAVVRGIEAQADAEDERHRTAMQALDDEQDARLELLDTQLKALDAAERAEGHARRTADLQKRVADAQQAATQARGTGSAADIAAARVDLTSALKVGDETSIANARERLARLAGQGNAAIKKADEELAEAQQDLRDEGVDQQRDAERAKLQAAQESIRDDIEARKRAEEEENRRIARSIDTAKQAEQDKLDDFLEKLATRKQAVQDDDQEELRLRRNGLDVEKQANQEAIAAVRERFEQEKQIRDQDRLEADRLRTDRREAEDEYRRATRHAEDEQRRQLRQAEDEERRYGRQEEDRIRGEERLAQDRFRADERKEQDKALQAQLAAVKANLELEKIETEAHFNGPNGTITKLKQAITDSELAYSKRLAAAKASFEAERKEAERVYTNPEKNGLLDLLEKARADEMAKLEQSKTDWQEWSKAASAAIKAAMADLDEFIKRGSVIPNVGTGRTGSDSRAAGSGRATSASAEATPSGTSGRQVQGTLGTWINDAMDITGVSDDWARGLFELAQKESSGDPHARNASGASGLFQTIPSTFKAYRDKNLPDDIFDPVANTVAAIRYIQQEYETGRKTGYPVSINDIVRGHGKKGSFFERGYDSGNLFRYPTMTYTPATGERAWIAERRPELLVGGAQTSRMMSASLLGSGPALPDYGRQGAWMASVHPGGSGVSTVNNRTINVSGVGMGDVVREIRRAERREDLLTGVRPS